MHSSDAIGREPVHDVKSRTRELAWMEGPAAGLEAAAITEFYLIFTHISGEQILLRKFAVWIPRTKTETYPPHFVAWSHVWHDGGAIRATPACDGIMHN